MEATLRTLPSQGPIQHSDPRHPRSTHRSHRLVDLHLQNRIRSCASHESLDMNHRIFGFTSYWIWRTERNKVVDLEQSLEEERRIRITNSERAEILQQGLIKT